MRAAVAAGELGTVRSVIANFGFANHVLLLHKALSDAGNQLELLDRGSTGAVSFGILSMKWPVGRLTVWLLPLRQHWQFRFVQCSVYDCPNESDTVRLGAHNVIP